MYVNFPYWNQSRCPSCGRCSHCGYAAQPYPYWYNTMGGWVTTGGMQQQAAHGQAMQGGMHQAAQNSDYASQLKNAMVGAASALGGQKLG